MCKYVSYLRVSTQEQGKSGLGIEAQRNIVNHYAEKDIVDEYVEVASGKSLDGRTELEKAIVFCNEHGHTLITAKADRLSRDQHDATGIAKRLDKRLHCCDCPDSDLLGLFFWFADRERQLISLRTKQALATVRNRSDKENKLLGKKPIGRSKGCDNSKATQKSIEARRFKRDEKLKTAITISNRERSHGSSYQSIADHLNSIDIKTSRNKLFTATSVRRLLVTNS